MFGRNKIKRLEGSVKLLTSVLASKAKELRELEEELERNRLIESRGFNFFGKTTQVNPVAKKIDLLMDHLGLEMQTVEAKESYLKLRKKRKK